MAWSDAFIQRISAPTRSGEIWIVEVFEAYQEPNGGSYSISTAEGYGTETIMAGPPRITGSRLTPVTWASTVGSCSVDIAGEIRTLERHITRGTVVRVLCGFVGWQYSDFEVVTWGMVWDRVGSGVSHTLEIRDPISALQNRMSTLPPEGFNTNEHTTTLSANYTVGNATITVGATSSFEYDTTTPIGVIKIASFYLTYTGQTATTFTGVSAAGQFGTTAANAAAGDTVTEAVILRGHPLEVALRLLLSRGVTGNSSYDHYPEKWGWGIHQQLIDIDDVEDWRDNVVKVASGSYQWDVIIEGRWDNPGSSLVGLLQSAGLYATIRQGKLTIRGGKNPVMSSTPPYLADYAIDDDDIVADWSGITSSMCDPNHATEYRFARFSTNATTLETDEGATGTLPSERSYTYDCSDIVFSNESAVRTEMSDRLSTCVLRVPNAVRLRLAGMRFAALAPGDVIALRTERISGRIDYTADGGRLCLVTQVSPDWSKNIVDITLNSYPEAATEFETYSGYVLDSGP